MAGLDVADDYGDADFEGASPDLAVVGEAWETWEEVAFAERFVAEAVDRGVLGKRGRVLLR